MGELQVGEVPHIISFFLFHDGTTSFLLFFRFCRISTIWKWNGSIAHQAQEISKICFYYLLGELWVGEVAHIIVFLFVFPWWHNIVFCLFFAFQRSGNGMGALPTRIRRYQRFVYHLMGALWVGEVPRIIVFFFVVICHAGTTSLFFVFLHFNDLGMEWGHCSLGSRDIKCWIAIWWVICGSVRCLTSSFFCLFFHDGTTLFFVCFSHLNDLGMEREHCSPGSGDIKNVVYYLMGELWAGEVPHIICLFPCIFNFSQILETRRFQWNWFLGTSRLWQICEN